MDGENTRGKRGLADGRAGGQSPGDQRPEATPVASHALPLGDGVLVHRRRIELRGKFSQTRTLALETTQTQTAASLPEWPQPQLQSKTEGGSHVLF